MTTCYAGLDVADGGGDRNALALRKGVVLRKLSSSGASATPASPPAGHRRRVWPRKRVSVQYDCIGVGAGVKAEIQPPQ